MGIIRLKKDNEKVESTDQFDNGLLEKEIVSAVGNVEAENDLPQEALYENKGRKTLNQNVFRFNDGTTRQFISCVPKNYFDKKTNTHKRIETCLCANSDGDLECRKNIFETKFYVSAKNEKIYSMKKDNCEVVLMTENLKKIGGTIKEQLSDEKDNKVVLKGVREGVDIEYEVEANQIKENIIIKERQKNYIFDFCINLCNLDIFVAEDYKSLELKSKENGNTVFKIPSPVMYDANGECSDEVSYEISQNDETLSIKVVADPEYFNAPERAFPVIIDPQVIIDSDEITSYKVYRKMRGSSGYTYNWIETTSQYIRVSRDSSYDYKTIVKIDKSKIGLLDNTINSVKLHLKKYSVTQSGNILANGSTMYMGASDISLNITSTFKSYSDTAEFGITIEPYSAYVYGLFYASGNNAPELEIEYLGNNDKPVIKRFSLAGVATGNFNAGTGETVTSFETISTNDLKLDYEISHIYKQSSADFGLGDNFRLNLHETFIKNNSSCDYTDQLGTKVLFTEYYYYLDDNNNKQYVSKSNVVAGIDGQLTYQSGGKTYEVQAEYRSSTGLKVMPKLENVKNAELVEQRSDEFKQLESQVQSYENVLNDYVLINTEDYDIDYDQPISESKYNALKNPSYCCLVLSKSEALQYKSLKKQKESISLEAMADYMPGLKSDDGKNTLADKKGTGYTKLFSLENSFAVLNNQLIEYFDEINNMDTVKRILVKGTQTIIDHNDFYDKIGQETEFKFYANKDAKTIFGTELVDMLYQRNLLVKQIEEAKNDLNLQIEQLDEQIRLIEHKRTQQIKQFNDYYKEYVNLKYKKEQAIKHIPENYLTDGTIYKGFNKYGDLVTIFDSYGNTLSIEYADNQEETKRIKRVYDGEDKIIKFEYNSKGRLREITDARGKNIRFSYDAATVVGGNKTSPTSDRLGKVEFSDGRKIEFSYTRDNTNNKYEIYELISGNKQKTRLNYASDKLSSVYNYSLASSITHGKLEEVGDGLITDSFTISYTEVTTTISDQNGNKEKYLFDDNEYVVGALVEKGGYVVSAEMYDYVPYEKNNIQYADKDCLNKYSLASFDFVKGDTEDSILNAFNNPTKRETNARKLNSGGTVTKKVTIDYSYNDEQRVMEEKSTVTVTGKDNVYSYKKYSYNTQNLLVKTESWTEGEETTKGKNIEETEYDENGNVVKSYNYNSLDISSKFYTESEYSENGQVLSDLDETGEHKTKYDYIPGTNIVRTEILPNGSKVSYGHDMTDMVTSITQSTEEGEENSNQTLYTCGKVTEVRSGNNVVNYEYDYKGRMTKVGLNGEENYQSIAYTDDTTESGISGNVDKAVMTNAKGETFTTITDKQGNVRKVLYGTTAQVTSSYNTKNQLSALTDDVEGSFTYEYNLLEQITRVKKGTEEIESYTYDNYGNLKEKVVGNGVNHIYTYQYKNEITGELEGIELGTDSTVKYERDANGRLREKEIRTKGDNASEQTVVISENYYYRKVGDHATNQISTIRYGEKKGDGLMLRDSVRYAYDKMGNIAKIYENGDQEITYEYDGIGRLTRENNKILGKTYLLSYDNNGNIQSRKEYAYTLKKAEDLPEEYDEYTYGYEKDTDKVLEIFCCEKDESGKYVESTKTFAYDNIGNPTRYKGKELTWSKGRQLTSYAGVTFGYNGQGQRISKTQGGVLNNYQYDVNGNLVKESGKGVEYYYEGNEVIGMKYGGKIYFYRKDIFGNITEIIDNKGKVVVRYRYDGWGKQKVMNPDGSENESSTFLGNINPFRYRGYYYDIETGLYYLKTRYYDPEIGRFITIDDISYLAPDTINGLNLYAYCGNNPIKYVDRLGNMPIVGAYKQIYKQYLLGGFDNKWWGRINVSASHSIKLTGEQGFFYAVTAINVANGEKTWGVGINAWDWFGIEANFDSEVNLGIGINITPWVHFGVSIGADGITISMGITIKNISYDFSFGIGLAPVLIVGGIAAIILSGGQLAPMIFNWFRSIFS